MKLIYLGILLFYTYTGVIKNLYFPLPLPTNTRADLDKTVKKTDGTGRAQVKVFSVVKGFLNALIFSKD